MNCAWFGSCEGDKSASELDALDQACQTARSADSLPEGDGRGSSLCCKDSFQQSMSSPKSYSEPTLESTFSDSSTESEKSFCLGKTGTVTSWQDPDTRTILPDLFSRHTKSYIPDLPRKSKLRSEDIDENDHLMSHPTCTSMERQANCDWVGLLTTHNAGDQERPKKAGHFGFFSKTRRMVSKSKKRYTDAEFDLDLQYITCRTIAMGFPSVGTESIYRNPRDKVITFLNQRHPQGWKMYNLCAEKSHQYEPDAFMGKVAFFPFSDHCPPPLALMRDFCEDASSFLSQSSDSVVALHCKAGKGRTGTMLCALLAYAYGTQDVDKIMRDYGARRSWKGQGVTVPAQKHSLHLFAQCVSGPGELQQPKLWLANPLVRHPTVRWRLTELKLGPFFPGTAPKIFPVKIASIMDPKSTVEEVASVQWRGETLCALHTIDLTGDFGRLEVKVGTKPPFLAGMWLHYAALQKCPDSDGYTLRWPKKFISSIGKKDAKHKLLPAEFAVDAIFQLA